MKLALLFSLATLTGCAVREKVRVEHYQLKPEVKVYLMIPAPQPEEPNPSQERTEKNKEAENFA